MLKIFNLVAFIAMITVNYLANSLPINGKTTGELSEQYSNLFTPAGITFSIWGVIYLLLFLFIILQWKESSSTFVNAIGISFILNALLNAGWIFAWHYEKPALSLLIMIGIIISLFYINNQLKPQTPLLFKISFGVYLGWISIALLANTAALLVHYDLWRKIASPAIITIILIFLGILLSAFEIIKFKNPYIALSVIWAFTGIIIRHGGDFPSIIIAASTGIVVMIILMVR